VTRPPYFIPPLVESGGDLIPRELVGFIWAIGQRVAAPAAA
jgi:hypothetical protein